MRRKIALCTTGRPIASPSVTVTVLEGGTDTYVVCQAEGRRFRESGLPGLIAPSAVLLPGAADGWRLEGGRLRPVLPATGRSLSYSGPGQDLPDGVPALAAGQTQEFCRKCVICLSPEVSFQPECKLLRRPPCPLARCMARDELPIPVIAALRHTLLSRIVYVDEAKSLAISVTPLEIVQQ